MFVSVSSSYMMSNTPCDNGTNTKLIKTKGAELTGKDILLETGTGSTDF